MGECLLIIEGEPARKVGNDDVTLHRCCCSSWWPLSGSHMVKEMLACERRKSQHKHRFTLLLASIKLELGKNAECQERIVWDISVPCTIAFIAVHCQWNLSSKLLVQYLHQLRKYPFPSMR